ncbi:hypothetical protein [Helicobacter fennelliae]|uniref:hypothetical protein n=1 Tax=Helicobacter fennelliae TaxID=215 RepID=UPI000E08BDC0|nr:hypothetical protein [Helicobacter fennelliae]STQ84917.1 Uncharacterised protein [Helicobacter fennelliae]
MKKYYVKYYVSILCILCLSSGCFQPKTLSETNLKSTKPNDNSSQISKTSAPNPKQPNKQTTKHKQLAKEPNIQSTKQPTTKATSASNPHKNIITTPAEAPKPQNKANTKQSQIHTPNNTSTQTTQKQASSLEAFGTLTTQPNTQNSPTAHMQQNPQNTKHTAESNLNSNIDVDSALDSTLHFALDSRLESSAKPTPNPKLESTPESNIESSLDSANPTFPALQTLQTQSQPNIEPNTKPNSERLQPVSFAIDYDQLIHNEYLIDNDIHIKTQTKSQNEYVIVEIYDSMGALMASLSFVNGMLHGISKAYKDNQIIKEVPYINGQIHGVMKTYKNAITIEESFSQGKQNGPTKIYTNSILTSIKHYKNGKREGEMIEFDKAGKLVSQSYFSNGVKNGKSFGYGINLNGFTNSKQAYNQLYHNGSLEGKSITYNEDEKPKIERFYRNGFLEGVEIVYEYPSQNIAYKGFYKQGLIAQPYENYDKTDKQGKQGVYYSIKPLDFDNAIHKQSNDVWIYQNGTIAISYTNTPQNAHTQNPTAKNTTANAPSSNRTMNIYRPNGTLESSFIFGDELSAIYYNKQENISSKLQRSQDTSIVWIYNDDGSLRTKSQENAQKSMIQSYNNNLLENEIIWLEDQEITIQKGFYPNQSLEFEHYYKNGKMISGTLYDTSHRIISSFTYSSQDEIFDEAFPHTAALKRDKTIPQ